MVISSGDVASKASATAATDACTNCPLEVVMVLLETLAKVGSAMTLPPERIMSPSELALEKRRGNTIRRSAGEGRKEVTLERAEEASISASVRISGKRWSGLDRAILPELLHDGGGEMCLQRLQARKHTKEWMKMVVEMRPRTELSSSRPLHRANGR